MPDDPFKVTVVYPYQKAESNQISLKPGENILVLKTDPSGWWIGKKAKGDVGIFPSTYTSVGQKNETDEHPLKGLDRNNTDILCKVIDQLFQDNKLLRSHQIIKDSGEQASPSAVQDIKIDAEFKTPEHPPLEHELLTAEPPSVSAVELALKEEIERLTQRLESSTKAYEEHKAILAEKDKQIEQLSMEDVQKKDGLSSMTAKAEEAQEQLASMQVVLAERDQQIQQLSDETKLKKEELVSVTEKAGEVHAANLEALKAAHAAQLDARAAELEALRARMNTMQVSHDAEVTALARKYEENMKVKLAAAVEQEQKILQAKSRKEAIENVGAQVKGIQSQIQTVAQFGATLKETTKMEMDTMAQFINTIVTSYANLPARLAELQALHRKEVKERKALYQKIQDLKGKVRVYCRLRPLLDSDEEQDEISTSCVQVINDDQVKVDEPKKPSIFYEFDRCFFPHCRQQELFDEMDSTIDSVLDGYNVCVFAYGQTGAGKTHTMQGSLGSREEMGISPCAVHRLFDQISSREAAYKYEVSLTVIEVYNDNVYDMLKPHGQQERLELRTVGGHCRVDGATTVTVTSAAQTIPHLEKAFSQRSTGSTMMNERSSRSHCILTLYISGINTMANTKIFSKLNLIDLAGSERTSKSKAQGERLSEANAINQSLSHLGRVITALHQKQAHVPFRDSKLTHLLQDSLSGDSRTILIAAISPLLSCVSETCSTLHFASSVRKLELGEAKRNVSTLKKSAKSTKTVKPVLSVKSTKKTAKAKEAVTPSREPSPCTTYESIESMSGEEEVTSANDTGSTPVSSPPQSPMGAPAGYRNGD